MKEENNLLSFILYRSNFVLIYFQSFIFGGLFFLNIYVGNLKFSATEEEIKGLFEQYGTIESIKMITDRQTGRARGFCFVEMEDSVALTAIEGLNGKELDGRNIQVNEARERKPRNNDNFRSR